MSADGPPEVTLVVATNDHGSRFWAAATPRDKAVALVQKLASPDCTVTLSDRTLAPEQTASLKLQAGHARQLPFGPRKDSPLSTKG